MSHADEEHSTYDPADDDDFPPIADIFGPGGLLEKLWPDYEHRQDQLVMAESVWQALTNGERLVVEAGTGIGKTLAYLYPLLKFNAQGGGIAVVATATKALQRQILDKDLPLLEKVLSRKINAEVCFGAGNYLCPRRLGKAVAEVRAEAGLGEQISQLEAAAGLDMDLGQGLPDEWQRFLAWTDSTDTGLYTDNRYRIPRDLQEKTNRDPENCLGAVCPTYSQSFYFQARNNWKRADLLIANHHLLAFDLLSETGLFPEIGGLVIDEAHSFPEVLLSSAEIVLSIGRLERILAPVMRTDRFKDPESFLNKPEFGKKEDLRQAAAAYLISIVDLFKMMAAEVDVLDDRVLLEEPPNIDFVTPPGFLRLVEVLETAKDAELPGESKRELEMFLDRLLRFHREVEWFIEHGQKDYVYWTVRKNDVLTLHMCPVESGPLLASSKMREMGGIVFTSATLSVGTNLDYFMRMIGFDADVTKKLPSPFPYEKNTVLYLPRNLHDPGKEKEEFFEDLTILLPRLFELTRGGVFCLFTSRAMLEDMHEYLLELDLEWPLISQLDHGAVTAYRDFMAEDDGVLLGLSSFWEGVDVKGDRLRHVILIKLPFMVPTEPHRQARQRRAEEQGVNPFMTIQVPEAVLRFKQGFGRLIRSSEDRGIISVLDPRVQTRAYGRIFLESIPKTMRAGYYGEARYLAEQLFGPAPAPGETETIQE